MEDFKDFRHKLLVFILGTAFALMGILASANHVYAAYAGYLQNKPLDFSLQTLDGRTVTASSLRGNVVVLALGGSSDPFANSLLPQLQRIADRYQGRPVTVVWVSNDSDHPGTRNYASVGDLQNFVSRAKFTGLVLRDPQGTIFHAVGANQYPTIVLLGQGNVSTPLITGFNPDNQTAVAEISSRVDKLLQ